MSDTVWVHSGYKGATGSGLTGADVDALVADGIVSSNDSINDPSSATDTLRTLGYNFGGLQYSAFFTVTPTANIAGRFRVPDDKLIGYEASDPTGYTLRQYAGKAQADVRMSTIAGAVDVPLGSSAWASIGGNKYTKTLATGLTIVDVVADFDDPANIAADGDSNSHYLAVAIGAVAGGGAQGNYNYNSGTGLLTVGAHGSWDPRSPVASGLEYCVAARPAMTFRPLSGSGDNTVITGNTVSGLRFTLAGDETAVLPAALYIQSGDGTTINNNFFRSVRRHAISFGSRTTNNYTHDNVMTGLTEGSIAHVFNATGVTGGSGNRVNGCLSENDISYMHSPRGHDGKYLARAYGLGSFIVHGLITSHEWKNCQSFGYAQPGGAAMDLGQHYFAAQDAPFVLPSNYYDPETYPSRLRQTNSAIRAIDEACFEGVGGSNGWLAYINARMRFPYFKDVSNGRVLDLNLVSGTYLLYGCEIVADMGASGRNLAFLGIGPNARVICIGCSFYNNAASGHGAFKYGVGEFTAARVNLTSISTGANPIVRCAAAHLLKPGSTVVIRSSNALPSTINASFVVADISDDGTHWDDGTLPVGTVNSGSIGLATAAATYLRLVSPPTITNAGTATGTTLGKGKLELYGCRFGLRSTDGGSTRRVVFGDSLPEYDDHSHLVVEKCTTFNFTSYSDNSNFNTLNLWQSVIDADVLEDSTNPFLNASGSDLSLTVVARTIDAIGSRRIRRGINAVFAGQRGCYQYPVNAGRHLVRRYGRQSRFARGT